MIGSHPLPATMRFIACESPGGPEALQLATGPLPNMPAGHVLIRVAAAGVNRPDILQRQGNYPAPPGHSPIIGLEVAGHVVAAADDVAWPTVGEPVAALTNGGGYAEFANASAGSCLPVPDGLSLVEAASLPETFFTVWHNVFERGRLTDGETLLVHGGASGIGVTAIQLGKAFGARVLTTAGGREKCAKLLALGADCAIDYLSQDFVEVVKAETNGRGADVILDILGGDAVNKNFQAAAVEGRILQIGFLDGAKIPLDAMRLLLKRLTWAGSTLRSQDNVAKARIAAGLRDHVWPMIAAGQIRPVIHATFPFEHASDAHRLMESRGHFGKIILTL